MNLNNESYHSLSRASFHLSFQSFKTLLGGGGGGGGCPPLPPSDQNHCQLQLENTFPKLFYDSFAKNYILSFKMLLTRLSILETKRIKKLEKSMYQGVFF